MQNSTSLSVSHSESFFKTGFTDLLKTSIFSLTCSVEKCGYNDWTISVDALKPLTPKISSSGSLNSLSSE